MPLFNCSAEDSDPAQFTAHGLRAECLDGRREEVRAFVDVLAQADAQVAQRAAQAAENLPGLDELKGTGLFDGRLPAGFSVPLPSDDAALREDEDPLEPGDLDLGLAPRPTPEE